MKAVRSSAASAIAAALVVSLTTVGGSAAGTSFVWKVTNDRGALFLVGSVHMLSKDYYPLSPALEAAFKESDLLVEEVDFADVLAPESQLQMLKRGLLPSGESLEQVVTAETFRAVSRHLTEIGMPIEPLSRFKPWALALTLLSLAWQQTGFDQSLGLDRHFYDRARAEGKPTQALETLDFQISRFDGLARDEQDRLLASTLRDLATQKEMVTALADAWKSGDAAAVERIALDDLREEPELYERLHVERNRTWLPKLDLLFSRPGTALVVVGAAHLIGPDGLLGMFRAKGYRIEQL
jgi:uncharacterized protein YbaP (TraB family)